MGYTFQLTGQMQQAVESFHSALAIRPDDALTGELLTQALQEFAKTI